MQLKSLKGDTDQPEYIFYMFINSSSGGNAGKQFFDLDMDSIRFLISGHQVLVRFYDLKDKPSLTKGLRRLKMHTGKIAKDKLRVIICGGDGTVGWVLSLLKDKQINIQELVFGILPLGTGNDFSRALNWGPGEQGDLLGPKFNKLKSLVSSWITADVKNFDVWHVDVQVYNTGRFQKIQNKTSTQMEEEFLSRDFTNYCGFGMDGQIGYDFDKVRSQSRAMNMLMYAGVGIMNLFKQPQGIESFVQKMTEKGQVIFNNRQENRQNQQRLQSGFKNILALNLNSYMGGVTDIWQTQQQAVSGEKQKYRAQKTDDDLIQFVSWKNQMDLALQRVINKAYRVTQGKGPFVIQFKDMNDTDYHTFLQLDGQFFKVYNPQRIVYSKSKLTSNGQIRVISRILMQ